MVMRIVSCFAILLISVMLADARTMEPMSTDESMSSATCDACLKVSRKVEETLNNPKLFEEAHKLSSEVCHILPTDVKVKCLKKSGAYLHEARFLLQEFFQEEHICNGTGLCLDKSKAPLDNGLVMEEKFLMELQDERGCIACRRAVRELLTKMRQPRMRTKIVKALLDYCEEAEDNEEQCKQAVYRYVPMVLNKLEKLKASESCAMIGMCGEEISM